MRSEARRQFLHLNSCKSAVTQASAVFNLLVKRSPYSSPAGCIRQVDRGFARAGRANGHKVSRELTHVEPPSLRGFTGQRPRLNSTRSCPLSFRPNVRSHVRAGASNVQSVVRNDNGGV